MCGDCVQPSVESAAMVEDITQQQVVQLVGGREGGREGRTEGIWKPNPEKLVRSQRTLRKCPVCQCVTI